MGDVDGWTTVGEVSSAIHPLYEEADYLSNALGRQYRVVMEYQSLDDEDHYWVEERITEGERWVPVTDIGTVDDHTTAEQIAANVESDEYRVVCVQGGGHYIERLVEES